MNSLYSFHLFVDVKHYVVLYYLLNKNKKKVDRYDLLINDWLTDLIIWATNAFDQLTDSLNNGLGWLNWPTDLTDLTDRPTDLKNWLDRLTWLQKPEKNYFRPFWHCLAQILDQMINFQKHLFGAILGPFGRNFEPNENFPK